MVCFDSCQQQPGLGEALIQALTTQQDPALLGGLQRYCLLSGYWQA